MIKSAMAKSGKKGISDKLREKYHFGRYKIIRNMLREGGKDTKVLDIGCGNPCPSMREGAFLDYLQTSLGVKVVGLDIENRTIPSTFVKGDVRALPFKDNAFDVVVAVEVFEHITGVERGFEEVRRVLKKNGIFIFSTPKNNLLWKLVWSVWQHTIGRMWEHTHLTNHSKREWIRILKNYFDVEKVKDYCGIIFIAQLRKKS